MSVDDLTAFLHARINEDAAEAERMGWVEFYEGGWETQHVNKVLAECEAKRRIIDCLEAAQRDRGADLPGLILSARFLATVYADHRDFRDEWRP